MLLRSTDRGYKPEYILVTWLWRRIYWDWKGLQSGWLIINFLQVYMSFTCSYKWNFWQSTTFDPNLKTNFKKGETRHNEEDGNPDQPVKEVFIKVCTSRTISLNTIAVLEQFHELSLQF